MLKGNMRIKMDREKIKKEAANRLNVILEEINQPDFSQLCTVHQVQVYNTLRFSIKEHFGIGIKNNDQIDKIVQDVLWPMACSFSLTSNNLECGSVSPTLEN